MKLSPFSLSIAIILLVITTVNSASANNRHLGGMQLLPGYKHHPLQGIDSIVGEIRKENGLTIVYEIGAVLKPGTLRTGGSFTDRPKNTPKDQLRWYREQTVNGQPAHLAFRKDDVLLVSFPNQGMNISAKINSDEDLIDALLMVMTYPNELKKPETP